MQVKVITGPVDSGKTAWLTDFVHSRREACGVLCHKVFSGQSFRGYDLFFMPEGNSAEFIREREPFQDGPSGDSSEWFNYRRFRFNQKTFCEADGYFRSLEYSDQGVYILDEAGPMEMEGRGFHDVLVFLLQKPGTLYLSVRPSLISELPEKYGFVPQSIRNLS